MGKLTAVLTYDCPLKEPLEPGGSEKIGNGANFAADALEESVGELFLGERGCLNSLCGESGLPERLRAERRADFGDRVGRGGEPGYSARPVWSLDAFFDRSEKS
mmetsp:Transcript_30687/g.57319  ORF Transcript_30687/g.57319 Transcript_30687/m.57319 type:complete len:104 (+) Transcript_30687:517-828(+)